MGGTHIFAATSIEPSAGSLLAGLLFECEADRVAGGSRAARFGTARVAGGARHKSAHVRIARKAASTAAADRALNQHIGSRLCKGRNDSVHPLPVSFDPSRIRQKMQLALRTSCKIRPGRVREAKTAARREDPTGLEEHSLLRMLLEIPNHEKKQGFSRSA